EEIEKRAKNAGKIQRVLIEINVSKEASKYGVAPEALFNFLRQTELFKNISIDGLMTMAPYVSDPEETRVYFRELKSLFKKIKEENLPWLNMKYLSMGMSSDFEVAIEEGSNMIRIGTAIFKT
ncbi:MAG: YggS family pyridoxal phosphate-dependent enzyme, partial [Candidatus Subteraquimicrobiales bacterium]|nr:YggS family pyridoxal phosphate-dependent enzyme [Candidatus Subteraquimicrobiales bacterium]